MYTQCPECLTIYQIEEDALQASLGIVHCSRCDKRFDALRTLSDTLPTAPLTPLPELDPAARAPTLTAAVPPAAFEAAARQRSRDITPPDAAAVAGQHELDLARSASTTSADTNAPPRTSADDWFADLETELAATPEPSELTTSVEDDESAWSVELPDADDAETTDARSILPIDAEDFGNGNALEGFDEHQEATDDAAASSVTGESPPLEPTSDPLDSDSDLDIDIEPNADQADTSSVVSPRLLEGDVFDAETDASMANDDVIEDIEATTSAEAATADPATDEHEDAAAEPEPAEAEEAGEADADVLPTPAYVRPHRHRISATGLAWATGCLLLALALAAQLAWADRIELIRNPATRAWAENLCRKIPCRLPPIKDVSQLELVSRDVRPDPNATGALTITATVRNEATFRQPWPVVVVELTDLDNHAVAMRRFRPAEYMPDPARRAAGIAPGATAALAFEVADPGKSASGFRFSFE